MTAVPTGKTTLRAQRRILAVTRNRASVFRMLEVLRLFDDDDRVTIRTTIGPDSRYDHGVDQLLAAERIRPLPWESAIASTFDLAISATTHTSLRHLNAPVVVFPHGAGHHKRPPAAASGAEVFELTPQQLMHNGSVIPDRILLPGQDSLRRLRSACPQAVPNAVITGDPIAQQIHRHRSLRDTYRAAFGLRPGQRLLLVASSWGPGSLAAQHLDLVKRLVAELPVDEYRVAAAFHHNVTIHDGQRELERRLRSALDSGLILLPPTESWQAAVIASHAVIGDGGSISFYSAGLRPVAVTAHDPSEHPADGPVAALVAALPHLDVDAPLPPQIERLLAGDRPESVASVIGSSIDGRVDTAAEYRSIMYSAMNLPEPDTEAFLPVEPPRRRGSAVTAFATHTAVRDTGDGPLVRLTRYPAATAAMTKGRHLVARIDDTDPRRRQSAAVLITDDPQADLAAASRRLPACRVLAKPLDGNDCALFVRGSGEFRVGVDGSSGAEAAELAASAYYGLLYERRARPATLTVRCGGRTISVRF